MSKKKRMCALKWNEMSIKTYEEYSSKLNEIKDFDLRFLGRQTERVITEKKNAFFNVMEIAITIEIIAQVSQTSKSITERQNKITNYNASMS